MDLCWGGEVKVWLGPCAESYLEGGNSCGGWHLFGWTPPAPLHLGVWSASLVPNGVQWMNLDNGFMEKPKLQFLILQLLLRKAL